MIWPDKKESPLGKDCLCEARNEDECGCNVDWSDNEPWNAAIDACKEAHAAQAAGLVPISYDEAMKYSHEYGDRKDFIRFICSKFGTPSPKVLSVDEMKNISKDARENYRSIIHQVTLDEFIAQEIHKAQGGINICPAGKERE